METRFRPAAWNDKVSLSGAVAVGARNFLILQRKPQYHFVRRANAIAFDIREKGSVETGATR